MTRARSPRTVATAAFLLVAALGGAFLKQATDRAALERRLEAIAAADGLAATLENEIQAVFGQLATLQAGREAPAMHDRIEAVLRTSERRIVATLPPRSAVPDAGDLEVLEGRGPVAGVMRGPGGTRKVAARLPVGPGESALVAVLDLDTFVATKVLPRVAGFDYRIAALTPRRSLVAQSTASVLDRPVERQLRVGSGRWSVAVAPREGWVRWPQLALRGVVVLAAALCAALLAFDVARDRTVLRQLGASARARLKEANRRLVEEVGQRESLERQFSHASFHDGVTGLPNRRMLDARLDAALQAARSSGPGLVAYAVVLLDRLGSLTDRLGHGAADELVAQAARRFASACPEGAVLGRSGDAEFGIVFPRVAGREAVGAALDAAQRTLEEPFEVRGQRLFAGAHAGVAFSADGYEHPEDLSRGAHIALGDAQRERLPWATFAPSSREQLVRRHQLETDLHGVAERGELRVAFQPVVSLADGRIAGLEALVRWQHPVEGLVPPGRFVPLAEETGLITPITRWMIREACRHAATWRSELPGCEFYVSVNLSAHDMGDPGIAEDVREALEQAGLPAHALRLEVTESAMIDNLKVALDLLVRVRAMGVRILLDDFGTGYSSLSYLHRFPIDYLKVDQSFVARMTPDPRTSGVVRAILNLAEGMGIEAIAEGIETVQTAELLRELRCGYGQGYLYSRPVDAQAARRLLAQGRLAAAAP